LTEGVPGWKRGWARLGSWRWPIVAWFAATLVAVIISPSIWTGLGLWRAYVLEPLFVFVLLAAVIRTEVEARDLRRSLYATVVIVVAWSAVQFATGKGIPHPWDVAILAGRRATGPFPYPNALSLFVAPIGAWAFCLWLQDRKRLFSLLTAIVSLVGIILARSNGGFIALFVVSTIAMLLHRRARLIAIGSGVILAITAYAIAPIRMKVMGVLAFKEWSGKVRLIMWRETWEMLKAHPIAGAGFGGYPIVFKPFHKATFIEIFQYPHNILLNLWSETGLLGIAAFVWIAGTWTRLAVQRRDFCVIAPLLAILIQGLVDVPYFKNDLAIVFWMLAFLTTFSFSPDKEARVI